MTALRRLVTHHSPLRLRRLNSGALVLALRLHPLGCSGWFASDFCALDGHVSDGVRDSFADLIWVHSAMTGSIWQHNTRLLWNMYANLGEQRLLHRR